MPGPQEIEIGPVLRKWVALDETMIQCVESDAESYPRITDWLRADTDRRDSAEIDEPPTILVPYEEFRELVFNLPSFESLPILTNALKSLSDEPVHEFIAKCFSGTDTQVGDQLYVDTQGYDYPRYKATILAPSVV